MSGAVGRVKISPRYCRISNSADSAGIDYPVERHLVISFHTKGNRNCIAREIVWPEKVGK